MKRKVYWGFAALLILFGTAFVFITIRDRAETWQIEKELAEAKKMLKAKDVRPRAPMQVESVVIDGVGDLTEYLTFFESFDEDPSLAEYEKFREKSLQYGHAMRDFDYKQASPEQLKMARQINEVITTVQTNVYAKEAAERAKWREQWPRVWPQLED